MRTRALLVFVAILWVSAPHSAWAYLDPGSGSMLLQVLLGGFAGIVVLAKLYWRRMLELVGLAKPPLLQSEVNEDPAEQKTDQH